MFRFIKRHGQLLSLAILTIIGVVAIGLSVSPRWEGKRSFEGRVIPTTGIILPVLTVQVTPPGYPQIGEYWKINVYFINSTRDGEPVYKPASNATVFVNILVGRYERIFEKTADKNGETLFQCTSQYEAISFEAHYSGSSSAKVIISGSFLSSDVVNTLLMYNLFSVIGSFASDMLLKPRKSAKLSKWKKLSRLMLICVFCLFSFVTFTCIYVKLFRGTAWGYSEDVVGSLITFTSLRYIFYVAIICFFVLWVMMLVIRGLERAEEGLDSSK